MATGIISQKVTEAVTPPTDYSGRRHARLTRSMKALPPAILKVLVELRYRIRDGETKPISNRAIADATQQSEGFVSAAVRWLAGEAVPHYQATSRARAAPFIARESLGEGKGYLTTMLPPPELRPRAPIVVEPPAIADAPPAEQLSFLAALEAPAVVGDHPDDPSADPAPSAAACDESPRHGDHPDDPPLFLIHTDQEEEAPAPRADRVRRSGTVAQTLRQDGAADSVVRAILEAHPDLTHAAYAHQRTLAALRPGIDDPRAYLFRVLMSGRMLRAPREVPCERPGGADPGGDGPDRAGRGNGRAHRARAAGHGRQESGDDAADYRTRYAAYLDDGDRPDAPALSA